MSEITTEFVTATGLSAPAAHYFKNIESFGGQLMTIPSSISAKVETAIARTEAIKGARHIERTSEHIRGGIDRKANMVVGAHLQVRPKVNWPLLGFTKLQARKLNEQFGVFFADWAYDLRLLQDGEGHYDFGGMMWLAYRNLMGPDAETAGVIHYDDARATRYNHRWSTYVTVLDPDRIENPDGSGDGANLFRGRQLDKDGRWTGFHLRTRHPSEGMEPEDGLMTHKFVPRETDFGRPMSWHWFTKTRGAAQRGMTSLVTTLKHSTMLDRFDDHQLSAAALESMFAVFAKSNAGPQAMASTLAPAASLTEGGAISAADDMRLNFYDKAKIQIGGNRLVVMPHQDSVEFATANRASKDPSPFVNQFLRKFAMALNISFEQLSNDYSQTNYSSARAALLEVWRGVMVERRMFTRHVATQIYSCVIEEAIAKGWIKLPDGAPDFWQFRTAYSACDWIGPGMGWIDPLKEAQANQILVDSKMRSRARVMAEAGDQWDEVFEEIAAENDYADELGFSLEPVQGGAPAANQPGSGPDENDNRPGDK